MNKTYKKIIYIVIILITLLLISKNVNTQYDLNIKNKNEEKVYKVAFYNHPPYYFINDKSEIDGYYHELMEVISKELKIKYTYVNVDIKECLNKLINNEVDIVFGVSKDSDREKEILFSEYPIAKEDVSVYTKKDIEEEDLYSLEGLKFGYLENESNHDLLRDMLSNKNINVNLVKYNSYKELKESLITDEVDFIVYLSSDKELSKYNKIFNFSVGQLYLGTSLDNNELIKSVNKVLEKNINNKYNNKLKKLHFQYINEKLHTNEIILSSSLGFIFIAILLVSIITYKYFKKTIKLKKNKNNILLDIKNNNYLLYYQPIVNPKTNKIKGFEGLLRLKNKDKILSPYIFLNDIEETNMMNTISLYVLSRAISDYKILKTCEYIEDDKFYISINLSFREIEDEKFIEKIEKIIKSSNLKPNSICLEIVERFAIKDLQKIQSAIYKLKEVGFMVAIDDFGVEYSNLDILEKIDCDIVKLDKYFIDDIETSYIRKEVVHFISNVCNYTNKVVVCEGVETEQQKNLIKNIENDKFYIQGYFYSKPLDINDLKKLNISEL